jgi:hypothetical protein
MNENELDFQKEVERTKKYKLYQGETTKLYQSPNILFHYTKFKTAIEYILPTLTLKLPSKKVSNFRKENDPFENQHIFCNRGGFLPLFDNDREKFKKRVDKITRTIERKINTEIRMISFCMNNLNEVGIDALGCNKPRMWAQYGNNFKGICIAIKLDKLIEQNTLNSNDQFFHAIITYSSFEEIWRNKPRFNYSELNEIDNDDIIVKNIINREIKNIAFTKHKDFKDENEYRICHFTKDKYTLLNISESILGIVVNTHKINSSYLELLSSVVKNKYFITGNDWGNQSLHNWHSYNNI